MLQIELQPRQIIAPVLMGVAVFMIYTSVNALPLSVSLAAALAGAIHMTNMGLRDATFKELIAQSRVGTRDALAHSCMVVFDAVLLFGILTAAGPTLDWPLFVSLIIGLALVLPLVVFVMTRGARAPTPSQPGFPQDYWAPPAFLLLMALLLFAAQTMVAMEGSQPFISLVLLSSLAALNRSGSRFVGRAKVAAYVAMGATLVLLVASYLVLP